MITAYPLCWPIAYERTTVHRKKYSQFKTTVQRARDGVMTEVIRLGGKSTIISSNVPLRKDGMLYADQPNPSDSGVAVYFTFNGKQMVLACDRYYRLYENLRAIELSLEAMRGLARWGVSQMLERSFSGFALLEAPKVEKPWQEVLQCSGNEPFDIIKLHYHHLAKVAHPDHGGSTDAMAELNRAWEQAKAARGQI